MVDRASLRVLRQRVGNEGNLYSSDYRLVRIMFLNFYSEYGRQLRGIYKFFYHYSVFSDERSCYPSSFRGGGAIRVIESIGVFSRTVQFCRKGRNKVLAVRLVMRGCIASLGRDLNRTVKWDISMLSCRVNRVC